MSAKFRLARPDDAAAILSIYAPFCESSHVSFEIAAPSEPQMRERIERILPQYPWVLGEIDDGVAGYVYASQHRERPAYRWAVDVAVYIGAERRGQGLGRALYHSLLAILRRQGYFKALAGITLPNPSSVGLHEAIGFQQVAVYPEIGYKLGRWLDVGWWQLELQPVVANPPEPQPFGDIRAEASIAAALADGARLWHARREE